MCTISEKLSALETRYANALAAGAGPDELFAIYRDIRALKLRKELIGILGPVPPKKVTGTNAC